MIDTNIRVSSILLVDDNASLNMVNLRYIEKLEIAIQAAEVRNGKEALDFILKQNKYANSNPSFVPEVIILDLNMPVMDGFEFLKEYQKLDKELQSSKIIVLSSSNRQEEIEKAFSYKAVQDYWIKPITREKWLALKAAKLVK